MPAFNTQVSHSLGKEEAVSRMKGFMESVRGKYQGQVKDVEESWEGDTLNYSFKTMGLTISGNLTVEDEAIKMTGKLPIAAMAFKGKIEQEIRGALEKLLA